MKIKKQIEKIEGVELVQKADKGVLVVYLKDKNKKPSQLELLDFALENYPVGTRFTTLGSAHTYMGSGDRVVAIIDDRFRIDSDGEVWNGIDGTANVLFSNGKWAEIVKPLFKTEDGVDVYEGSDVHWVGLAEEVKYLFRLSFTKEHLSIVDGYKLFSSKEKAQAYIDAHKPLELVEGEIYTIKILNFTWILRFKSMHDKDSVNYYTHIDADGDDDEFYENDWMLYKRDDCKIATSSLEEKKQLITAEVNNGYFHGL